MLLKFSWVKVGSHSIMERYQETLSLILSTRNIAKNATANCGMWDTAKQKAYNGANML
jgi:hypothetical protein